MVPFEVQKLFNVMSSHFGFVFVASTVGARSRKTMPWPMSRTFFPMFSSRGVTVLDLRFRSLIRFKLIL